MPYDIRANISHSIDISLVIRTGLEIITGLKNNIVSKPTAGGHSIAEGFGEITPSNAAPEARLAGGK